MTLPALSPRLAALLEKARAAPGRLILALDATASREPTWDMATSLTASMAEEAAKIGGLDTQLCYYRGAKEFQESAWISDAHELINLMNTVRCAAGATQIARVLEHIRAEHAHEKVAAAVFIGDAVEEKPSNLYDAAAGLPVPLFMLQEGDGDVMQINRRGEFVDEHPAQTVEQVFRNLARLTGGAFGKFDAGAAKQLGELLRAVAAFATGGLKALANQNSDAARKLLTQMKHGA